MVSFRFCLGLFLIFTSFSFGQEIKIVSEVDSNKSIAGQPIKGTITITHDQSEKIEVNTFKIDGKPLTATLIREVNIEPGHPLTISIFSFQLPAAAPGIHLLPSITVRVGGVNYVSPMSSYTVENPSGDVKPQANVESEPSRPVKTPSSTSGAVTPLLSLEAEVEGKSSLYPGQRTKLAYYYYYRGNIELTVEQLPLLDAKGLVKIGEKEFQSYSEGGLSVTRISQEVEAVQPGEFSFGPSRIEGYTYEKDALGRHNYTSAKLSSEAPPVKVTVLPFPAQGKPASFNGAVGQEFKFAVTLLNPPEIKMGSEILLSIEISGKGNIKSTPLPEVCCQPGFKGFFKVSDLPPSEKVEDGVKTAVVRLFPQSEEIKEIPSLEFSYFDPSTATYNSLKSAPIPIHIGFQQKKQTTPDALFQETSTPMSSQESTTKVPQKEKLPAEKVSQSRQQIYMPDPIEIDGILPLSKKDIYNKMFGTWWALAIVPFCLAMLIYQSTLHEYLLNQRNQSRSLSSEDLMQQAFNQPEGSSAYFDQITLALKTGLAEAGLTKEVVIDDDNLPSSGVGGEVRRFLMEISEKRFATHEKIDYSLIRRRTYELLDKIRLARGGVK